MCWPPLPSNDGRNQGSTATGEILDKLEKELCPMKDLLNYIALGQRGVNIHWGGRAAKLWESIYANIILLSQFAIVGSVAKESLDPCYKQKKILKSISFVVFFFNIGFHHKMPLYTGTKITICFQCCLIRR